VITPDAQRAVVLPGIYDTLDTDQVIRQMVRRASSRGFEAWWRRAESVGFCAHPIHLIGSDEFGRQRVVWVRCNNRRAQVCPSCSDLYARDTWQLVHAGTTGGHHGIRATIASHPQVFVTLTAPSYGPVHSSPTAPNGTGRACHDHKHVGGYKRCRHGKPLWCSITHDDGDERVGQPLCSQCYDYRGHVLFTWHLPELWRRFTITLGRQLGSVLRAAGSAPDAVRVSFVKVVELQARAIPHIHALIRLDPHDDDDNRDDESWVSPIDAIEVAAVIQRAARSVTLTAEHDGASVVIGFGAQIDTQPVTTQVATANHRRAHADSSPPGRVLARRVAGYLAKYVTKSLADFGISARRLSAEAIADLAVSDHVRAILTTIAHLSAHGLAGIGKWLHTLGYRGHITSKSRRYSTTMTALRARRAAWTRDKYANSTAAHHDPGPARTQADEEVWWLFDRAGHATLGERTLIITAALGRIEQRRAARDNLRQERFDHPAGVPDG
jgi:hypothetical protein